MSIRSTMPPIVPPTMAPTLRCATARAGCGADDNDVSFDEPLEGPTEDSVYDKVDDNDGVDVIDKDAFVESADALESVD
jgi:hypothetical protein